MDTLSKHYKLGYKFFLWLFPQFLHFRGETGENPGSTEIHWGAAADAGGRERRTQTVSEVGQNEEVGLHFVKYLQYQHDR